MASDVKKTDFESIPTKRMPPVDLEKLLQEDREIAEKGIGVPFRFGYAFDVDYTLHDGKWHYQADKKIWNIKIFSEHAYSLNFIFSELPLIDNAELYIFNAIGSMIYGPVTTDENILQSNKIFLTDLIAGNEVVIQLIEPIESKEHSALRINKVVHGYINTFQSTTPSGVTLELIATEQPRAAYCANAEGRASLHLPWWANKMCPTGGKLELKSEGSVSYNSNFTVETGANFINY